MEQLITTIRSVAIESILTSVAPMRFGALCSAVQKLLPDDAKKRAALFGVVLQGIQSEGLLDVVSLSAKTADIATSSPLDTSSEMVKRYVRALSEGSKPLPLVSAETDAAAVSCVLECLFRMDPQFRVTRAGYCVYPCLPSELSACPTLRKDFKVLVDNPGVASRWPRGQYRSGIASWMAVCETMLEESTKQLVVNRRSTAIQDAASSAPALYDVLERWRAVVARVSAHISVPVDSLHHAGRHSAIRSWHNDVQKPLVHGFLTVPISLQAIEQRIFKCSAAYSVELRRRLPLRYWLELGGLMGHDLVKIRQRFATDVDVDARAFKLLWSSAHLQQASPRLRDEPRAVDSGISSTFYRQLAPKLHNQLMKRHDGGLDAASPFSDMAQLRQYRARHSSHPALWAFSRAAGGGIKNTNPSTEDGVLEDDDDTLVVPSSPKFVASAMIPSLQRLSTSSVSSNSGGALVSMASLANALLWTHELGDEVACTALAAYLRQYPTLVQVSDDGSTVQLVQRLAAKPERR